MLKHVVLICALIILAACVPVPPAAAPAPGSSATNGAAETPAITFIRSGGLAGKVLQWDIYPSGRSVSGQGTAAALSGDQVAAAVAAIEKLGFFEMAAPDGKTNRCADCYSVELRVHSGDKDRTLTFSPEASGLPAQLMQIMEQVNGLLQALPKE